MRTPQPYLIRPLSIDALPISAYSLQPIPFLVRIADVKLAHRQHHDQLHLEECELLTHTVPHPKLKRSPGIFDGVKGIVRTNQPTLGNEVVRPWPVERVAVEGLVIAPYEQSLVGYRWP